MKSTPSSQMPCPEWDDLKVYFDGEAPATQHGRVAEHLESCDRCTEEVRVMREIASGLQQLEGMIDPPADLRRRILARVKTGSRPSSRRNWLDFLGGPFGATRWALAAVTVIVIGSTWIQMDPLAPSAPAGMETGTMPPAGVRVSSDSVTAAKPSHLEAPAGKASLPPGAGAEGAVAGAVPPTAGAVPPTAGTVSPPAAGAPAPQELGSTASGYLSRATDTSTPPPRTPAVDKSDAGERKVAYSADLTLEVNNPLEAVREEIEEHLRKGQGRVEFTSRTTTSGAPGKIRMTLRVPAERLDYHLQCLSRLGTPRTRGVRSDDLTERWKELRAALARAPKTGEQRAVLERKAAELNRRIELATIDLTLLERPGK